MWPQQALGSLVELLEGRDRGLPIFEQPMLSMVALT